MHSVSRASRVRRFCRAAIRAFVSLAALATLPCVAAVQAAAQDTAAQEAAHRAEVIAHSPPDAAKVLFGREITPIAGPAQAVGAYERGCLSGAVQLPADGPNWQVMRPSRNRAWGHPVLIAFLERLAQKSLAVGWPGLLVGDIAQPRGGPMLTGHGSHQIGLDADIWLTPMPNRRFSPAERDEIPATDVVAANGMDIDAAAWTPQHRHLLETVAREPVVERIFVNAAIKRALCREAGPDRAWMAKVRPWWGHNYHFHVRLYCPSGEPQCRPQAPPPPGDGCGKELDWWFTEEALHPAPSPPRKPLRLADLPSACAALVAPPPGQALQVRGGAR
jgi:penicillin-insensitive murein DD-endopeptidase